MKYMNIQVLVQEFYAMEAVMAMLSSNQSSNFEPQRHSHSRWFDDFNSFRKRFNAQFAAAIFDYTVIVVAGELRYGSSKASQYLNGFYTEKHHRSEISKGCDRYTPNDILAAGCRLFNTDVVTWQLGFGGEKWWKIAKAGLLKKAVSDSIFIDHCVDLSHNSSSYFDKGAGIFRLTTKGSYSAYLDCKLECEPHVLLLRRQGYHLNRLLWRANNLNILQKYTETGEFFCSDYDETESMLLHYRPIRWGKQRLDYSEANICDDFICAPKKIHLHSALYENDKCA